MSRWARSADAHQDVGREADSVHASDLFERALADYREITAQPSVPALGPTRAGEFTPAATIDWTDDQLARTHGELWQDPAAQSAVEEVLEWRDQAARQRDAELDTVHAHEANGWEAVPAPSSSFGGGHMITPAMRRARRLTGDEECREMYEAYAATHYLEAERDCRGVLLNRRGRAAGITAASLFAGSARVAGAYASDELKAWWNRNGRLTLAAFRHQMLGRESDRGAARRARLLEFGDVAAV